MSSPATDRLPWPNTTTREINPCNILLMFRCGFNQRLDSLVAAPLLTVRAFSASLSLFLALTLHVISTFFLSFLPSSTAQALVDEKEEHQAGLPEDNVRRPATESLVHTKLIAEGLFDVSRSSGGRGTGTSPFDLFAAKMPRVEGRSPNDPKRAPDAFDVRACC